MEISFETVMDFRFVCFGVSMEIFRWHVSPLTPQKKLLSIGKSHLPDVGSKRQLLYNTEKNCKNNNKKEDCIYPSHGVNLQSVQQDHSLKTLDAY